MGNRVDGCSRASGCDESGKGCQRILEGVGCCGTGGSSSATGSTGGICSQRFSCRYPQEIFPPAQEVSVEGLDFDVGSPIKPRAVLDTSPLSGRKRAPSWVEELPTPPRTRSRAQWDRRSPHRDFPPVPPLHVSTAAWDAAALEVSQLFGKEAPPQAASAQPAQAPSPFQAPPAEAASFFGDTSGASDDFFGSLSTTQPPPAPAAPPAMTPPPTAPAPQVPYAQASPAASGMSRHPAPVSGCADRSLDRSARGSEHGTSSSRPRSAQSSRPQSARPQCSEGRPPTQVEEVLSSDEEVLTDVLNVWSSLEADPLMAPLIGPVDASDPLAVPLASPDPLATPLMAPLKPLGQALPSWRELPDFLELGIRFAQHNPKKKESLAAQRWNLYRGATTVRQFLDLTAFLPAKQRRDDWQWAVELGLVEVQSVPTVLSEAPTLPQASGPPSTATMPADEVPFTAPPPVSTVEASREEPEDDKIMVPTEVPPPTQLAAREKELRTRLLEMPWPKPINFNKSVSLTEHAASTDQKDDRDKARQFDRETFGVHAASMVLCRGDTRRPPRPTGARPGKGRQEMNQPPASW
mmetsp:Transcript_111018/g.192290  ORF Transcript_111018/g.192290 Transcript_111018/m.192290 type:complete len:579 (+) Transcript_111018:51-1787(+)